MSRAANSVNLNRETYDLLCDIQSEMAEKLGFMPTLGQVIRSLIKTYYGEAE